MYNCIVGLKPVPKGITKKIKGYRVSVGSMFFYKCQKHFSYGWHLWAIFWTLHGMCRKISYKTVVMAIQIRPACNLQEIFLHSSKWQPHSYSDLVDTWADSVCIHQLVLKMYVFKGCLFNGSLQLMHSNSQDTQ